MAHEFDNPQDHMESMMKKIDVFFEEELADNEENYPAVATADNPELDPTRNDNPF